jgi:hypothetical protein
MQSAVIVSTTVSVGRAYVLVAEPLDLLIGEPADPSPASNDITLREGMAAIKTAARELAREFTTFRIDSDWLRRVVDDDLAALAERANASVERQFEYLLASAGPGYWQEYFGIADLLDRQPGG